MSQPLSILGRVPPAASTAVATGTGTAPPGSPAGQLPTAGEVVAWAFARGRPVRAPAMRAVVAAASGRTVWTQEAVTELVWAGVVRTCRARGEAVPDGVAEALWVLLDHLDHSGRLAPGSDGLGALRRPLRIWSGLDERGQARPTARRPRSVKDPVRDADAVIVALRDRFHSGGGNRVGRRRR